ncbi:MAG TPA: L,D-transpeptidase [Candidatus Deferrimicrobium sp.]|nr:L,D-transpeptidase [Candidatus Deferrimicrobium sp.]
MRRLLVTVAMISSALVTASCGTAPPPVSPGPARQAAFAHRAAVLESLWTTDVADGVPAAAIAPLRVQLARSSFATAPPASPLWTSSDGHTLLDSLDAETAAAWTTTITAARQSAQAVIVSWSAMAAQYGASVASADSAAASSWPSELAATPTPAAITALVARWSALLESARTTAAAAAALGAILAPYGGVGGLENAARRTVASAGAHHLDPDTVPALLADLEGRAAIGSGIAASVGALIGGVQALDAAVGADAHEGSQLVGLQQTINQAGGLRTAHAASFQGEYEAVVAAYHAATSASAVYAVGRRINALSNAVTADINATLSAAASAAQAAQLSRSGCGHAVPMGKVTVVSLGQQSAAFYDNTCLVGTTEVTTGGPGMRTPMGSFRIYSRASPAHFVSMYRPGSPGYYTPETTTFAMAYEGGGYYLHDASWEPDSAFGPGSQNGPYASHGCIHIPGAVMAWLYSWASMGTRVIVTG